MTEVVDLIGHFGPWQACFVAFVTYRGILTGLNNLAYVFLVTDNEHWCSRPPLPDRLLANFTETEWKERFIPYDAEAKLYSQCSMYGFLHNSTSGELIADNTSMKGCDAWTYDEHVFGHTVTDEWNLVCENTWKRSLIQSTYMACLMLGILVIGNVSDRFGRRIVAVLSSICLCVSSFALTFSSSLNFFLVARVGVAVGISGLQVACFSLLAETIGPKFRIALNVCYGYGWITGLLLLPLIVWLAQDWRKLLIVQASFAMPLLLAIPHLQRHRKLGLRVLERRAVLQRTNTLLTRVWSLNATVLRSSFSVKCSVSLLLGLREGAPAPVYMKEVTYFPKQKRLEQPLLPPMKDTYKRLYERGRNIYERKDHRWGFQESWLYESPRWLVSMGKQAEACEAIRKIARFNKRQLRDVEKEVDSLMKRKQNAAQSHQSNVSVFGLFKTKYLRRNTLVLVTVSFLSYIVYYGYARTATTLGGNPYLNFGIAAGLECAGYTVSLVTTKYLKRIPTMISSYAFFSLTLLITAFTPKEYLALRMTVRMAGWFTYTLGYTTQFVFINEMFPTVARSGGFGLCTTVGRLGAALEPWINVFFMSWGEKSVLILYSAMLFVISSAMILLPETFGSPLPDTLEEGELYSALKLSKKMKAARRNTDSYNVVEAEDREEENKI